MNKKEPIDVVGEVAIMMLADFQRDLVEFAENNWAPSQVDMLKRAIKCVCNGEKTYP